MKNILKNWKTSLAGLFGLAAVIVPVMAPAHATTLQQAAALAVSLGLLAAKDGNKTGV